MRNDVIGLNSKFIHTITHQNSFVSQPGVKQAMREIVRQLEERKGKLEQLRIASDSAGGKAKKKLISRLHNNYELLTRVSESDRRAEIREQTVATAPLVSDAARC